VRFDLVLVVDSQAKALLLEGKQLVMMSMQTGSPLDDLRLPPVSAHLAYGMKQAFPSHS
jgi:hypothetical protein